MALSTVALVTVVAVPLPRQPGHHPQPCDRHRYGAGIDLVLPHVLLRFGGAVYSR